MPERHFLPPWSVKELDSCCCGEGRQALAYMYFEKEPLRRFRRRELLTRDESGSPLFLPNFLSCWASPKNKGPLIPFRLMTIRESPCVGF